MSWKSFARQTVAIARQAAVVEEVSAHCTVGDTVAVEWEHPRFAASTVCGGAKTSDTRFGTTLTFIAKSIGTRRAEGLASSCNAEVSIGTDSAHEGGSALAAELAALLAHVASAVGALRAFTRALSAIPGCGRFAFIAGGWRSAFEAPQHALEAVFDCCHFIGPL